MSTTNRHSGLAGILVSFLASCSQGAAPLPSHEVARRFGAPGENYAFVNGNFEAGPEEDPLAGWTVTTYTNSTGVLGAFPPTTRAQLNLQPGGSDLTSWVDGRAGSQIPAELDGAATLLVPRYGIGAVAVNRPVVGGQRNANGLVQRISTTPDDVDPSDGTIHVRFALAPVLQDQDPIHTPSMRPYFWIALTNVTRGSVLYRVFHYAMEDGIPWRTSGELMYTDWQLFDIAPGNESVAPGDVLELEVIAAECAGLPGHHGFVFVDGVGTFLPGLSVTASAPAQISPESSFAYTLRYSNGGSMVATNATIVDRLPAGVTFASVSDPVSCSYDPGDPAAGSTGTVTCYVGTVNPGESGSLDVTVLVTAGAGSTISHGNYLVSSEAERPLLGPLVRTSVVALTAPARASSVAVTLTSSVSDPVFGQPVTLATTVSPVESGGGTPSGTVSLNDNGKTLATLTLQDGAASFATPALTVGEHAFMANYPGDPSGSFPPGFAELTLTVARASTSVALQTGPSPSAFGGDVTMTAKVSVSSPGSGSPTGTVTFSEGSTELGTGTLDGSGEATFSTSALLPGVREITARYDGDAHFTPGQTEEPIAQEVWRGASSTTLTADPTPSQYGQPVTLTAVVSPEIATSIVPTGLVVFSEGSVVLGTASLDGTGRAAFTASLLPAGEHLLEASYDGDPVFTASGGSATHLVTLAPTAVGLTSSANPSVAGQDVTFTATVTSSASLAPPPGGPVSFKDGTAVLGKATLVDGRASFTTSFLTAASHPITARYDGDEDPNFESSLSSELIQVVERRPTTTVLSSSPGSSVFGQAVTLTASVSVAASGIVITSGTITFRDGGIVIGAGTLDASGQARITTSALAAGDHSIAAAYEGDAGAAPSTSPALSHRVDRASVTAALTSSSPTSVHGQPVKLTVTLTPIAPGAGTPSGTVTINDGTVTLTTLSLDGGTASTVTSTLAVATHELSVLYAGDPSFNTSWAVTRQEVTRASTSVVLAASPSPSTFGEVVTLAATVLVTAPGAGAPTGAVDFLDGTTVIGTATLDGSGQAAIATSSLVGGTRALTAAYSGDGRFLASSSPGLAHEVRRAPSTTSLAVTPGASVSGQPVLLTMSVSGPASTPGTASGAVTLVEGGVPIGGCVEVALSAGTATCTVSAFTVGDHSLEARYGGDDDLLPSVSPHQIVSVAKAASTVTLASNSPTVFGQQAVITASVSISPPGTGVPGGTAYLEEDGAPVATATLDGSGRASFRIDTLPARAHSFTARYEGDASTTPSVSQPLLHVVERATVLVTLTSSAPTSVPGQPVTLTVVVTAVAPGAGTPSGSASISDDGKTLVTLSLVGGTASTIVSTLAAGSHRLDVDYPGDPSFKSNWGTATQTVAQAATSVAVTSSRPETVRGRPVTFTVTVTSPHGTPTGSVTLMDDGAPIGTSPLDGGTACFTVRDMTKGTHDIVAEYPGEGGFDATTGRLAGGLIVRNSPPVAGAGTGLALGPGAGSSAVVPDPSGLLAVETGTIELWVKAAWGSPSEVAANPSVLRLGPADAPRIALSITPDRQNLLVTLGTITSRASATLDDGAWHHLAVASASGQVLVYRDGAPIATLAGGFHQASGDLHLGEGLLGEIDELRIWGSERTEDELEAASRRPLRGDEATLIGYWRMDEGSGNEIFDASLSALDGSVVLDPGSVAFTPSTAWRLRDGQQEREFAPVEAGYDPDGDPLTLLVVTPPLHGEASIDQANLRVTYRPVAGYLGKDTFTFSLSDDDPTPASSQYEIEVAVARIATCQIDADCAGGDVCDDGNCVESGPASGCDCGSTDPGPTSLWLAAVLCLMLCRARREPRERSRGRGAPVR